MAESYEHEKQNFIAFGADYFFFALSLGFIDLRLILPAFAQQLGISVAAIGALLTLLSMSWTLPQVIAGNISARFQQKKPLLLRAAFIGRPFTIIVPIVIVLTGGFPAWLNLMIILTAYAIFFLTDAFAAIPWFDLLARAFPANKRGRNISLWQVGKAAGLIGVSSIVGYVLSDKGPIFPNNYALLFAAASLCLLGSAVGLLFIKEITPNNEKTEPKVIAWKDFPRHLKQIWQGNKNFRIIISTRVIFSLSMMAFPFYVIYATGELHFPERIIGIFILAQTIGASLGSLLLGRVADRFGAQRVVKIGVAFSLSLPVFALLFAFGGSGLVQFLKPAYVWIYICIGIMDNLMMLGFMNYVFDTTPPEERTIYMGMYHTLGAIGVLGPIIAGWLVTQTSYATLFIVSLVFGIVSLILAMQLKRVDLGVEAA